MADIDMEQDPDPQALQSLRTACEGAGAGFSAVVLNAVQAVVTDLQRAHAADLQALRDEFYHDRDTQTKQLNSSIEDLAADIHDIQASLLSLHEEVASLNK
jgi:peptidoglycan hydrolase CwlO-like protein